MTDVFISYSRKDKDFVRQLYERLSAAQRDAWVDWEGIPLTADWWEEIKRGIEAADSFLFIISPDSLASRVCNQEIEYAVSNNKRLIPIVHREAMSESVHQALARHNWLYARPDDDLDVVVDQLLDALNTDLDYVRLHTRLLMRAREWHDRARNDSFLLRGVDLTDAELWLAQSGGKEPKPTELHTAYIHASRRAMNNRQRGLLAGVSVALGVTVILALVALGLFGLAENRRQESDLRGTQVAQQAGTATHALGLSEVRGTEAAQQAAAAMAAEATSARRAEEWQALAWAAASERVAIVEDHDLALVLAVAANNVPDAPAQAQAQLIAAAYAPGTARVFADGHESRISALDVSPNGEYILSAGYEGSMILWNTLTGEAEQSITFGEITMRIFGGLPLNLDAINALAYHPADNARAAFGTGRGVVALWDTVNWRVVWEIDMNEFIDELTFSPDGTTLYIASNGWVHALNAQNGALLRRFNGRHSGTISALALSPDGALLASGGDDGIARVWDANSGDQVFAFGPLFSPFNASDALKITSVIFAAESSGAPVLITSTNDRVIARWSMAAGDELPGFDVLEIGASYTDLAISPDRRQLLAGAIDGTAYLFDITSGRLVRRFRGHTDSIERARFSPDGVYIYTASHDGTLRQWFTVSGAQSAVYTDAYAPEPGGGVLTITRDGRYALTGGRTDDAALVIRDLNTGEITHRLEAHTDSIAEIAVNASGTQALTAGWDEALRHWEIATGALLREYPFPRENVVSVAYNADESAALLVLLRQRGLLFEARVALLDLTTGAERFSHPVPFMLAFDALFTANETQIIVSGANDNSMGAIALLDVETGAALRAFDAEHTSNVNTIMLSADESRLLSAAQDFTAILWDVSTGSVIRRFIGHTDIIGNAAFSPDETRIVTAGFDGSVRVWNAGTGDQILAFSAGRGAGGARRAVFAPDGASVFAQYRDGALIQWTAQTDPARVLAWVQQQRYLRELTCAERAQFRVGTC